MIAQIIEGFKQLFPKVVAYPIFSESLVAEVFTTYQKYLNAGGKPYIAFDQREYTTFLADPVIKAVFNGMGGTSRWKTSNEKVMARDVIWSSLIVMRRSGLDLKAQGGTTPVSTTPTTYTEPAAETPTYTDPVAPGYTDPMTPVVKKSNTMMYAAIAGIGLVAVMMMGKKGKR